MKCMDRFLFLFFIVSLSRRLRKERRKEKFSRTVGCVAPLYATVTVPRTTFDRRRLFFRFDCRPCLSRKEKRRKKKKERKKKKNDLIVVNLPSFTVAVQLVEPSRSPDPASRTSFLTLPRISNEPRNSLERSK